MCSQSRRRDKDERVTKQQCCAQNKQWADVQEQQLIAELADEGADVVRPQRPRCQQTRERTGHDEAKNVEIAISIPRLAVTDQER